MDSSRLSTQNHSLSTVDEMSPVAQLQAENAALKSHISSLEQRIQWFEKQFFGAKSEKRIIDMPDQYSLFDFTEEEARKLREERAEKKTVNSYQRGCAKKQRPDDCVTDSGLRFGPDVPVKHITVTPAALQGDDADQYDIIDTRYRYKIAQQSASYVILCYELPVLKRKDNQRMQTTAMIPQVLDNSVADVSFLTGLLVDKFLYHLPLYRQHQRLQHSGITLARSTLTALTKRACELLRPIVEAQLDNVLRSRVLAMDETPVKAGRTSASEDKPGKMKTGWFWPLYGDADEIVFTYSSSRGRLHIEQTLNDQFSGILLSDGYAAYTSYAEKMQDITQAQCWVHTRRQYLKAQAIDPERVKPVLDRISALYTIEKHIQQQSLSEDDKRLYRLRHSKPIVDRLFIECQQQLDQYPLAPTDPLHKALAYTLKREQALRVFLDDPDVALDTNHLERGLRPIPMGRKNWLFCWTELGAEHVGIIQSLITTCRLHDINPSVYLTDVLQRINHQPASAVLELTPRMWKQKFAEHPMTSMLQASSDEILTH